MISHNQSDARMIWSVSWLSNGNGLNLENTTVANNTTFNTESGLIDFDADNSIIINSIFWDNNSLIRLLGPEVVTVNYSNIEDGEDSIIDPNSNLSWGNSNTSLDPMFCNPALNNYSLYDASPLLSASQDGSYVGAFGQGCVLTYGCTNPYAVNFDSEVIMDDGSCQFEEDNIMLFHPYYNDNWDIYAHQYNINENFWIPHHLDGQGEGGYIRSAYDPKAKQICH